MQLEKPKLFPETKGFLLTIAILLSVLLVHLLFKYQSYQEFISKPFYYTYADVLNSYKKFKRGKSYQILKLKSDDGFIFYTTSYRKEKLDYKRLRLQVFPDKSISFKDYLGAFYLKSRIKYQEKKALSFKDVLLSKVAVQHKESAMKSFYSAIFFASPLDKKLREKISMLGVSHLVALSGFHLGILWGLVYGILYLLYRAFQQKYFPYRHALFDVGFIAMFLLGIYLWFVDFPPSLLRAYAMVFIGWSVLLLGMELLSFTFLTIVLFILVALFPSLLVSLSFWLSVAGVFYIFLLLHYSQRFSARIISLVFIPFGIFILMLPIVHNIFAVTSSYQLLSPLLSLLFIPFYPLAMLLHIIGVGGILDNLLLWLFSLPQESTEKLLSMWAMLGYVSLSIASIWHKRLFYLLLGLALGYGVYLFAL